jgi:F-type H+-transporting ATPase subunit b
MKRLLFKPLQHLIDRRESTIARSIENANDLQAESKRMIREGMDELNRSRTQAQDIIGKAKDIARKEQSRIIKEAKDYADRIRGEMRSEINSDVEKARRILSGEILYLTTKLSEQILEKEITGEINDEMITKLIRGI